MNPWAGSGVLIKRIGKEVPKMMGSIPRLHKPSHDSIEQDARQYVARKYASNPGAIEHLIYPTSHKAARAWLRQFFKAGIRTFWGLRRCHGSREKNWLWHSVLTPLLNIGLLTPSQVVHESLAYAKKQDVPLNSLEGFIRQIIGWREFMRATYEDLGVSMRTTNHWNHTRSIRKVFTTGPRVSCRLTIPFVGSWTPVIATTSSV